MLEHLSNFSVEKWSSAFHVLSTSITTSLPKNFPTIQESAEIIIGHLSSASSLPPPPLCFKSVSENGSLHIC